MSKTDLLNLLNLMMEPGTSNNAWEAMHQWHAAVLCLEYHASGVTRRKQHQPGITLNDTTTHVPTAGSSAALTKPNQTPTRHPRAKGKTIL